MYRFTGSDLLVVGAYSRRRMSQLVFRGGDRLHAKSRLDPRFRCCTPDGAMDDVLWLAADPSWLRLMTTVNTPALGNSDQDPSKGLDQAIVWHQHTLGDAAARLAVDVEAGLASREVVVPLNNLARIDYWKNQRHRQGGTFSPSIVAP